EFAGEYAAGPHDRDFTGEYAAGPETGYPGEALEGYQEPGAAGYPGEPAGGYLDEETMAPGYPGDYRDAPLGAEPAGIQDAPLADDYPREYQPEDRGARYPASRAGQAGRTSRGRRGSHGGGTADAPGGYPDGPPPAGYPDEQDFRPYPEELAATEYG